MSLFKSKCRCKRLPDDECVCDYSKGDAKVTELSATKVSRWLKSEVERLEYPVGSLDICRDERTRVASKIRCAVTHIEALIKIGR